MTENKAHQTSTQFPIMYKSIKMNSYQEKVESNPYLNTENDKIKNNDEITPILSSSNDYIQRG